MSSNPMFDAIEDELFKVLEVEDRLPNRFVIRLSAEEMAALVCSGAGLRKAGTSERVLATTSGIELIVAGKNVIFVVEGTDENPSVH